MRALYLDDSGKPHANHQSLAVSFAGFSVEHAKWHTVVKQVSGAKALHFPRRGRPADWEIKSVDFLTPNAWKRANNRRFCFEVIDILRRNACVVYAVSFVKANARKPLTEEWIVPLSFQVLAAKFACELGPARIGTMVCDWSTHANDRHVCNCVTTFAIAHGLFNLVGGVTYGSSRSLVPIQVADLVAAAFRRTLEGQTHLSTAGRDLMAALRAIVYDPPGALDALGHPARTDVQLF